MRLFVFPKRKEAVLNALKDTGRRVEIGKKGKVTGKGAEKNLLGRRGSQP